MKKRSEIALLDDYFAAHPGGCRAREVHLYGGRSLDGLRAPGLPDNSTWPKEQVDGTSLGTVEVIEVKSGLSEEVIGQVLVAVEMLRRKHPTLQQLEPVIVCEHADPDLLRFVQARGIRVWSPDNVHLQTANGDYMRSRKPLLWHRPLWVDAVEPLRSAQPSLFITEVPLGGTMVNLLRIPSEHDLLAKFENEEKLRRLVADRDVELIEVRANPRRGVAGRLIVHGELVHARYGLSVSRRRVISPIVDPELKHAFAALEVELDTPEAHAQNI